ncbi:MAG: tetratricopeptide repeat protein [Acidobacteria bacterium]|nr:tetratricopeptide repeat protein [Acidobacteriota bacterium]
MGMKCTDPQTGHLITRYELGALEEPLRERFVAHLVECAFCHEEVYSMAPFMGVLRRHREAVLRGEIPAATESIHAAGPFLRSQPYWRRKPVLAAATLLVAVTLGVAAYFVTGWQRGGWGHEGAAIEWRDVRVSEAEYVAGARRPVLRGAETAEIFDSAMDAYQQNDFATAAERLEVVSRLEPEDQPAHFYWGVALLMSGNNREAIQVLRQTLRISSGSRIDAVRYYLAVAYLMDNRVEEARSEIEAVIELNGKHKPAAQELKSRLLAARP